MALWELGVEQSEAREEARLIIEHVSGMSYAEQLISDLKGFPDGWFDKIATILDDRRRHRPVQYCLGEASFCGSKFLVEEGVLIPRTDTEMLVQVVQDSAVNRNAYELLQNLEGLLEPLKMAEIGLGSGAVLISLLKRFPNARGWGCDVSEKAISLTEKNARAHGVEDRLELVCASWTAGLPVGFDVIVSNPPYIPQSKQADLQPEIRLFEPAEALFVEDEDGLTYFRSLASGLPKHFAEGGGFLALECGDNQSLAVLNLLRRHGFKNLKIHRDPNNLPRVVSGQAPAKK
jgi:release factor glutamine methyltransferase